MRQKVGSHLCQNKSFSRFDFRPFSETIGSGVVIWSAMRILMSTVLLLPYSGFANDKLETSSRFGLWLSVNHTYEDSTSSGNDPNRIREASGLYNTSTLSLVSPATTRTLGLGVSLVDDDLANVGVDKNLTGFASSRSEFSTGLVVLSSSATLGESNNDQSLKFLYPNPVTENDPVISPSSRKLRLSIFMGADLEKELSERARVGVYPSLSQSRESSDSGGFTSPVKGQTLRFTGSYALTDVSSLSLETIVAREVSVGAGESTVLTGNVSLSHQLSVNAGFSLSAGALTNKINDEEWTNPTHTYEAGIFLITSRTRLSLAASRSGSFQNGAIGDYLTESFSLSAQTEVSPTVFWENVGFVRQDQKELTTTVSTEPRSLIGLETRLIWSPESRFGLKSAKNYSSVSVDGFLGHLTVPSFVSAVSWSSLNSSQVRQKSYRLYLGTSWEI